MRQFWSLAKRICIKKEADVPEEEDRDVPIEEIEEAFSETPQPSLSRTRSPKIQLDVIKKLEKNSNSVSLGRIAAADKSFF